MCVCCSCFVLTRIKFVCGLVSSLLVVRLFVLVFVSFVCVCCCLSRLVGWLAWLQPACVCVCLIALVFLYVVACVCVCVCVCLFDGFD